MPRHMPRELPRYRAKKRKRAKMRNLTWDLAEACADLGWKCADSAEGPAEALKEVKMDNVRCKNAGMQLHYNSQMARVHKPTRWYCPTTAEALGMHLDIQEAFENIGALSLLCMNYPSYPALTSEFLALHHTTTFESLWVFFFLSLGFNLHTLGTMYYSSMGWELGGLHYHVYI